MYDVRYQDKRGAGVGRKFRDIDDCISFLRKLRFSAIVLNDLGEKIGGVDRLDDRVDNKRIRWSWHLWTGPEERTALAGRSDRI
jgi:hypothetical protein